MEDYQSLFIELLKRHMPSHSHMAEELSDLLGLSVDSVYRRLRGDTSITLTEAVKICLHYNSPLDALSAEDSNAVNFTINRLTDDPETFITYLSGLHQAIKRANAYENRQMIYAAEDLPVFYHFFLPHLAHFKSVYWTKSILNLPQVQLKKVEQIETPPEWKDIVNGIGREFLDLPTIEIWNEDTMKSTLQQIKFYWEAGFFQEKQTALDIIEDLQKLVNCMQLQAELGRKVHPGKMQATSTPYQLYVSDLMIGNNTVSLNANETKTTFIGYNTFNYMQTKNAFFSQNVQGWLDNFISKSTLISAVAEKQRNQFFKKRMQHVIELYQFIENDYSL